MTLRTVVCVKQVPDPVVLKFDLGTRALQDFSYIMNPYDRVAVEEAVRIRKTAGQGEVTILTAGPVTAETVLRAGLTMGVDRAVHIQGEGLKSLDASVTSFILARAIKNTPYDMILCGMRSIDHDNSYVGVGIAEQLKLPLVSSVLRLEVAEDKKSAVVHRRLEKGDREAVECKLPAVFTFDIALYKPRYVPFLIYLAGLRKSIVKVEVETILKPEEVKPATKLLSLSQPKPRLKKGATIASNLPASERIKLIMSGGAKEKGSKLIEKPPDISASELIRFLEEKNITQ